MTSYVCAKCGQDVSDEGLEALPGVKCPHCGYRILFKKRPQIIRKIKAI